MLLPEMRMVAVLAPALSATALFAIVERSMLTVVPGAAALTALPPVPEMVDPVTLTNTLLLGRFRPSCVEPVMVTFFSEATLKLAVLELGKESPVVLPLITVSVTNKNTVELEFSKVMPVEEKKPRKLRIVHFSIWTALAA